MSESVCVCGCLLASRRRYAATFVCLSVCLPGCRYLGLFVCLIGFGKIFVWATNSHFISSIGFSLQFNFNFSYLSLLQLFLSLLLVEGFCCRVLYKYFRFVPKIQFVYQLIFLSFFYSLVQSSSSFYLFDCSAHFWVSLCNVEQLYFSFCGCGLRWGVGGEGRWLAWRRTCCCFAATSVTLLRRQFCSYRCAQLYHCSVVSFSCCCCRFCYC